MKVDYEVPASGVKPTAPTHAEDAIASVRRHVWRGTVLMANHCLHGCVGFGLTRSLWSYRSAQQSAQAEPMPPLVTDEQSEIRLGRYLQLLEDPGGELTIDDVTSPEYQAQFVSNSVDVPNFGFTSSAYWARLALRNESGQADHRLLKLRLSPHAVRRPVYPVTGGQRIHGAADGGAAAAIEPRSPLPADRIRSGDSTGKRADLLPAF